MPQFAPGELKTARAPITVQPSGLSCQAELYLVSGGVSVATSGLKPFTSTGAAQDITFPITMPGASGTYAVYLDIFVSGTLIAAYKATEDVVIAAPLIDPNISFFAFSWTSGAIASDFLVNSWQTATIGVSFLGTAWQLYYTFEVNLVLAGAVKASGRVSITGAGGANLYADIQMPSLPGVYDIVMKAYQGGVLTGVYPRGQLTVYGIAEPSNLSYENLSFSIIRDPQGSINICLSVVCDIRNTGNATITREVALWYHSGPPYGWRIATQLLYQSNIYPPILYGGNASRISLTLAPGQVFHYYYVGEYLVQMPYNVQLRDNMGGKSAYV